MFTRMDESTEAEWAHISQEHGVLQRSVPDRVMGLLRGLEDIVGGFGVNQLHHSLQTATMARRAGASEEMVLCSLCHDMGKAISVPNHGAIAAEMLRPYVSEAAYQVIRTHQDFQGRHYYHHAGLSRKLRDQYRDESWFALAEQFTDDWDQAAFDPDYEVDSLESFEPLVRKFFARPRNALVMDDA